jgi:Ca2+-binding RTX toxin-like protein
MIGVNLSGAEFGSRQDEYGVGYEYPNAGELDYFLGKGIDLIRLPFMWERMQTELGGELDPAEFARLQAFLDDAGQRQMKVVLDLHNFGRYGGEVIGSAEVPVAAFQDFWTKMAGALVGHSAVYGLALMNEPQNMGGPTVWPTAAQAAVDGIRSVDDAVAIIVGGDSWSGSHSWAAANASLKIVDPSDNIIYEAHQYFDRDSSGTYSGDFDAEGAYPTVGIDRLQPFLDWLKENNARGFIGEYGVPDDDPRWLDVLDRFLKVLADEGIPSTVLGCRAAVGRLQAGHRADRGRRPASDAGSRDICRLRAGPAEQDPTDPLSGDDEVWAGDDDDVLEGGAGNDLLAGGGGDDRLHGGAGRDILGGQDGDDIIFGGAGYDKLYGDAGHDTLHGGEGGDTLTGQAGDDVLWGDEGADRFVFGGSSGTDRVMDFSYADGDRLDFDGQIYSLRETEEGVALALWGGGTVHLIGVSADEFRSQFVVSGTAANAGRDVFWAGASDDVLRGGDGDDLLAGGEGNDRIYGDEGNDILGGQDGDDTVFGGAGDDHVYGDSGSDEVDGGAGRDFVAGQDGNDRLRGGSGADTVSGGLGNDVISGDAGDDELSGDEGADTFVFDVASGEDKIMDFSFANGDRLDLSGQTYLVRSTEQGIALDLSGGGVVHLMQHRENDFRSEFVLASSAQPPAPTEPDPPTSEPTPAWNAGNDEIWAGAADDVLNGGDGTTCWRGEPATTSSSARTAMTCSADRTATTPSRAELATTKFTGTMGKTSWTAARATIWSPGRPETTASAAARGTTPWAAEAARIG